MRLITFIWLILPFSSFAQELAPVEWSFDVSEINDQEYELIFTADIEKGWTVYSQYIDDGGPVPTTITYETKGLETVGKSTEEGYKKEGMDDIFEMNVIKFFDKEPYIIKQRIKKGDLSTVSGYLTFMCCDDERCLPPTDIDFSLDLSKASSQSPKKEDRASVTTPQEIKEASQAKAKEGIASTASSMDLSIASPKKSDLKSTSLRNISWAKAPDDGTPVNWSFGIQKTGEGSYDLLFKADIDETWTVYSQYIGEGGPVPTEIVYEAKEGVELVGKSKETGARKEGMDPIFGINVIKFLDKEPFNIKQSISVESGSDIINGYLTYMACDDSHCLAPTDVPFSFDLIKEVSIQESAAIPVANDASTHSNVIASSDNSFTIVGNTIDQTRPKLRSTHAEPLTNCGDGDTGDSSLFWMFLFGFLGGLFALLTPCVFPIIPMTVSFFTKDTKRKGWVSGLIYGASIVVIYVTIGLLITALFGEEALNSLSTNWIANTLFFIIFVFFAFSFFGFYELRLPSSWSTNSDKMADRGGLLGIFFMAFTLALVSFSCTGPIIGAALVESASNQVGPFIVMLGFSLGLAIPFGLFAAFPAWLNSLPQSGGWMNSVKVVLGFIELALAFKFLTVADLTSHWGILKYEVFLGIWIIIALAMAAYGMGWLKFPHDSPIKKISLRRWVFTFASLLFAGYLASGFIYNDEIKSYNPLGLMSGIAPPVSYNLFLEDPAKDLDSDIKSRYSSFGKCANNINCFKDYFEGLAYAQEVGKPIFLDHTGHGCVNCRRTEDNIWSDERIRKMLNDDFVLVSLYVDDREKLDEILISQKRQKKLRTIGNRWADFQIVNFDQISQPLYVMVTPREEVVTMPREYKEGIEDYFDYLNCGLQTFKSVSLK